MSSSDTTVDSPAGPGSAAPVGDAQLMLAGRVGTASGLLFLAMLVWEYGSGLQPDGADVTTTLALNQAGFTIALAGYVLLALGLLRSGATGGRRGGRIALIGFAAGFAVLVVANVLTLVGVDAESDPLYPVGGLLQTLGGLAVGILVARAGVWGGWQRWWPLVLAVYWLVAMFLPLFADVEPGFPREALWALSFVVLGLAVLTDGGRQPLRPTPATGR
jgi:hypothetical protein